MSASFCPGLPTLSEISRGQISLRGFRQVLAESPADQKTPVPGLKMGTPTIFATPTWFSLWRGGSIIQEGKWRESRFGLGKANGCPRCDRFPVEGLLHHLRVDVTCANVDVRLFGVKWDIGTLLPVVSLGTRGRCIGKVVEISTSHLAQAISCHFKRQFNDCDQIEN